MSTSSTTTAGASVLTVETALSVLALAAGGVSSLLLVIASSGGPPLQVLFWAIDVPGIAIVVALLVYARRAGLGCLSERLTLGLIGGILLTLALDMVRTGGVHLGYLPDSITMFGNMITGRPGMAEPTLASYTLGAVYHLLNGISFGLIYAIVFGRSRWWGPVLFAALFVETGMMTLPPMAKQFGPFGLATHDTLLSGYFLTTLLAHIAMGITLGVIIQRFAHHRGLLPELLHRPSNPA